MTTRTRQIVWLAIAWIAITLLVVAIGIRGHTDFPVPLLETPPWDSPPYMTEGHR